MPDLELEALDADGALTEAIAGVHGSSRADFLHGATVGGAALLAAAAAIPAEAEAQSRDSRSSTSP